MRLTHTHNRFMALMLTAMTFTASFAADGPHFSREIRPILSDNCFKCHGPDAGQRKKDLRLDQPETAITKGLVVPGNSATSELVKRITSTDPDFHMPPPDSGLALNESQIAKIIAWIDAGAAVEKHWAFVPPVETAPPTVDDPGRWIRNPIDAFVLKRLRDEGLAPSARVNPETLLRRVTFDLTGLPPDTRGMDAFAADSSSEGFESAVDVLLASPAYGEHMASAWLDAARYADTFGYQSDRDNFVWPWRDWVVHAFNDNLPYDDFITWQLAGDLLPDATQDQVLATAFNRLHRQTNEGGSVLDEFRTAYVADRVDTVGTAFMGLTMGCARCHDHKFDPIAQRDYYAMFSFFNNIDESGMYSHYTDAVPSPSLLVYEGEQREKHQLITMLVRDRERELDRAKAAAGEGIDAWLASAARSVPVPLPMTYLSLDTSDPVHVLGPQGVVASSSSGARPVAGAVGGALLFSGDDGININNAGAFERTDPFSFALWLRAETPPEHAVIFHRTMAAEDAANRGYEMVIDDGHVVFRLCHFWPGNAISVRAAAPIPAGEWVHVAVTYDGSSRANGLCIYIDGGPAEIEIERDHLIKTVLYGGDGPAVQIAYRGRDAGFEQGSVDEFMIFESALTWLEARALFRGEAIALNPDAVPRDQIADHYCARVDAASANARERLLTARREEAAFVQSVREIMVMREMPGPRVSHILARGQYDQPRDAVYPDVPASIMPFSDDLPRNRLGFAKWLTNPNHPLTARVAVNRIWQQFFGHGLVETQEDFGSQGGPPTHPELLDYLARRFIGSGWDVKALCRLIVTSAAYQQESVASPELRERDPANELLARGPSIRLSAEEVRDAALAASGLLVRTIGGPGVKPYESGGLWKDAASIDYAQDHGDSLYRRSLYSYWKRTIPPSSMLTLDAPTRESCVVRRESTATPLQSLLLLNDVQYVEAARALAEFELKDSERADNTRLADIFRKLLGRFPSDRELAILKQALDEQQAVFADAPDAAKAYSATGERPVDETIDPVRAASLTAVAQLVMNFDEFVTLQ